MMKYLINKIRAKISFGIYIYLHILALVINVLMKPPKSPYSLNYSCNDAKI